MDTFDADAVRASRLPLTADAVAALAGERAVLAAVAVTRASPSTNTELLAALAAEPGQWPHLSALVADHQTAGRGRLGREWLTPQGAALTVSFVLKPRIDRARWGLIPLVVGLACVKTLRADGIDARLKWPNDIVVRVGADDEREGAIAGWGHWRKVAGILCEAHGDAVVAGIGINVSQAENELPVPHAASLATLGSRHLDRASLLGALSHHLAAEVERAETDADAFVAEVAAATCTLGQQVIVERDGAAAPGAPRAAGAPVTGTAESIAPDGALVVRTSAGESVVVTAGDVRLRAAPTP